MKPHTTCQVTSFYIDDPPKNALSVKHHWVAVGTVHVYDDAPPDAKGLNPEQAIIVGEVARVIVGRASADSESVAMEAAVRAVLFQIDAIEAKRMRSFRD
jgi:hypothetical protein